MELLVSYQRGRYGKARREILRVLKRLGDEHASVERTAVDGVSLARTALDGREVVRNCRELFLHGFTFEHAVKWVPVDYWCEADLQAIRRVLAEKVREQIAPNETWGMNVAKRRWQRYHTQEIVAHLAGAIDRKVNLNHPDKLVRVDVVGNEAAVSVLRPGEVFSAAASRPPNRTPRPAPRASFIEPERHHAMISDAAYFLAEQRDFCPGHELEDWLSAERDIDSALGARQAVGFC
jgi:tRNA(Ser,Leu) C12 N-acetylase TAN1